MKNILCARCGKEGNSFIHCPLYGTICMNHCKGCPYFSGIGNWTCLYRTNHESQQWAERTVLQFKKRIEAVNRKTAFRQEGEPVSALPSASGRNAGL